MRDPRVDAYIAQAPIFAQPILQHLRALWQEAVPQGVEGIKWGMPTLMIDGRNVAGMAAFKAHCALVLHTEPRSGDAMGQFGRICTMSDLPADLILVDRLKQAAASISRNRA